MKTKIKFIFTLTILFFFATRTVAGIVNEGNTTLEYEPGKFADLQGLDWLTVDETLGTTRTSIENGAGNYLNEGWRYATRVEVETLWGSLWGGTVSGWSKDNFSGANWFTKTFGTTGSLASPHFTDFIYANLYFGLDGTCTSDITESCVARIAHATNHTVDINGVLIDGTFTKTYDANSGAAADIRENAGLDAGLHTRNGTHRKTDEQVASLLVRRSQPISSPHMVLLMLVGLLAIFASHRKFLSVGKGPDTVYLTPADVYYGRG